MLNQEIVQRLISIGVDIEKGVNPSDKVLVSLKSCSGINMITSTAWETEVAGHRDSELISLL